MGYAKFQQVWLPRNREICVNPRYVQMFWARFDKDGGIVGTFLILACGEALELVNLPDDVRDRLELAGGES